MIVLVCFGGLEGCAQACSWLYCNCVVFVLEVGRSRVDGYMAIVLRHGPVMTWIGGAAGLVHYSTLSLSLLSGWILTLTQPMSNTVIF